jgi:site-specific recombinase XerD
MNKISKENQRELSDEFANFHEKFAEEMRRSGRWSEYTLSKKKNLVRRFLFFLEDEGFKSFEQITLKIMNDCLTKYASRYKGGLSSAINGVRTFLKCLHGLQLTSLDLSVAIPDLISPRRQYIKGFSAEEVSKLLSVPDTDTPLGKRNYAIMMLAAQTGLRAIDIVNLNREDIDWHGRKIRISQHKTGRALCVPLETESGNAIADYLLKARPKCDIPNVFVSQRGINHIAPKLLLTTALSQFVHKYMKIAGIDTTTYGRRAFHSFRRGFGTRLLEAETPLELLWQMMGQYKINSVVPYLSIEEQGLKSCALPLLAVKESGASK